MLGASSNITDLTANFKYKSDFWQRFFDVMDLLVANFKKGVKKHAASNDVPRFFIRGSERKIADKSLKIADISLTYWVRKSLKSLAAVSVPQFPALYVFENSSQAVVRGVEQTVAQYTASKKVTNESGSILYILFVDNQRGYRHVYRG